MSSPPKKIGLIIGSTRPNRISPQIADWILSILKPVTPPTIQLDLVDLATLSLPIFNEPIFPKGITSPPTGYTQPHTITWSNTIASYSGFIILSAQRNWGIPAELKNAIDYLYWEWNKKPVGLICYGGHGGEQVAAQLRIVLNAMGVNVLERQVNMAFAMPEGLKRAFRGEWQEVGWEEKRGEIVGLFEEVVRIVEEGNGKEK